MITVTLNRADFEYDIHSLVKAFYPGQDVSVSAGENLPERHKEPFETGIISTSGGIYRGEPSMGNPDWHPPHKDSHGAFGGGQK